LEGIAGVDLDQEVEFEAENVQQLMDPTLFPQSSTRPCFFEPPITAGDGSGLNPLP